MMSLKRPDALLERNSLIPSPTNHSTLRSEFWLQNFVSRSSYLDMLRAPTRFSLKIQNEVNVEALIGDGIRGFSLAEVLVVLGIIGLIAVASYSFLGSTRAKARDIERISEMNAVTTGLALYKSDYGHFPCRYLSHSAQPDFLSELVLGGYLNEAPKDPQSGSGYNYFYLTFSNTPGGDCGKYYMMNYDVERESAECLLEGQFVTAKHCHIMYPPGIDCADPYLTDESGASPCQPYRDTAY